MHERNEHTHPHTHKRMNEPPSLSLSLSISLAPIRHIPFPTLCTSSPLHLFAGLPVLSKLARPCTPCHPGLSTTVHYQRSAFVEKGATLVVWPALHGPRLVGGKSRGVVLSGQPFDVGKYQTVPGRCPVFANSSVQSLVVCFCCCLLYTSPSPRDCIVSRMPSSA